MIFPTVRSKLLIYSLSVNTSIEILITPAPLISHLHSGPSCFCLCEFCPCVAARPSVSFGVCLRAQARARVSARRMTGVVTPAVCPVAE